MTESSSSDFESATPPTTAPPAAFVPDYRPGKANTEMRNPAWRAVLYNRGTEYLDWQDEWVYCFKGVSQGYKFRRDGTGSKIPIQVPDGMVAPMVWGDWIYYVRGDHQALKRVRTDGAVVETLVEVSDRQDIPGFIIRKDQLLYAVCQIDSFGVLRYAYHSYSLATGADKPLSLNGDFGFYGYVPIGDWFFNVSSFYAVSFGRDSVSFLEQIAPETSNSGLKSGIISAVSLSIFWKTSSIPPPDIVSTFPEQRRESIRQFLSVDRPLKKEPAFRWSL